MVNGGIVRQLAGAGRWFPGTKNELERLITGFLNEAIVPEINGRIISAIAPHAGFIYSGSVAGRTFRAIQQNILRYGVPETVIALGFSHRESFAGLALMDGDKVASPLRETEIDSHAISLLTKASDKIRCDYRPHRIEHSAENLIPFIQVAAPDAKLVVALTGDHDMGTIASLTKAFYDLAQQKHVLLIASTDMLHSSDYDLVTRTDKATLQLVERMDIESVTNNWKFDHQIFCGISPVLVSMLLAKKFGCVNGNVLAYKNSGDDFPESRGEWVVGYGSAVFAVG